MKTDITNEKLLQAIVALENVDQCRALLGDLCTIGELKAMSQRFEVALMLSQHCVYSEIEEKTGASSATISRVARSLNYGAGGYKTAIARVGK